METLTAVSFVTVIATIVVPVANGAPGNTIAVCALKLVLTSANAVWKNMINNMKTLYPKLNGDLQV